MTGQITHCSGVCLCSMQWSTVLNLTHKTAPASPVHDSKSTFRVGSTSLGHNVIPTVTDSSSVSFPTHVSLFQTHLWFHIFMADGILFQHMYALCNIHIKKIGISITLTIYQFLNIGNIQNHLSHIFWNIELLPSNFKVSWQDIRREPSSHCRRCALSPALLTPLSAVPSLWCAIYLLELLGVQPEKTAFLVNLFCREKCKSTCKSPLPYFFFLSSVWILSFSYV